MYREVFCLKNQANQRASDRNNKCPVDVVYAKLAAKTHLPSPGYDEECWAVRKAFRAVFKTLVVYVSRSLHSVPS